MMRQLALSPAARRSTLQLTRKRQTRASGGPTRGRLVQLPPSRPKSRPWSRRRCRPTPRRGNATVCRASRPSQERRRPDERARRRYYKPWRRRARRRHARRPPQPRRSAGRRAGGRGGAPAERASVAGAATTMSASSDFSRASALVRTVIKYSKAQASKTAPPAAPHAEPRQRSLELRGGGLRRRGRRRQPRRRRPLLGFLGFGGGAARPILSSPCSQLELVLVQAVLVPLPRFFAMSSKM